MTPTQILQQCKDEVADNYGYESWVQLHNENYCDLNNLDHYIDEAAMLFAQKMCERQREIDINNTGFIEITTEKLNSSEYAPFITADDGKVYTIDKQSIINAPLATEEL